MKKGMFVLAIALVVFFIGDGGFTGIAKYPPCKLFPCLDKTTLTSPVIAAETPALNPTSAATDPAIIIDARINEPGTPQLEANSPVNLGHTSVEYDFTYTTYRVKRGDNLTDITRRHSSDIYTISVAEVVTLNGIKNKNRILPGQKLMLPLYYAKEIKAEVPAIVQAAVAPEKKALAEAKRDMKIKTIAWMLLTITVMVYLALARFSANRKPKMTESTQPNTDAQKFFTPNETREAFLKKSGQEIDEFLEWGAVVVPRGPGSDASTVKKFKNLQDLLRQNPDLRGIPLEDWNNYLWGKINKIAPAPAEPASTAKPGETHDIGGEG